MLAPSGDLTLRKRPESEIVDTAGQRVGDPWYSTQICRSGEQELARRVVAIQARLDCQQKPGRSLNLVDARPPAETGNEALRVARGQRSRGLVVQRQVVRGQPSTRERPRQGALSSLARAEQSHGSGLAHSMHDRVLQASRDEPTGV